MALLGDSAHAMQPNLGQGGCMAIEDGYQLAVDLTEACEKAESFGRPVDVEGVLKVRNPVPVPLPRQAESLVHAMHWEAIKEHFDCQCLDAFLHLMRFPVAKT